MITIELATQESRRIGYYTKNINQQLATDIQIQELESKIDKQDGKINSLEKYKKSHKQYIEWHKKGFFSTVYRPDIVSAVLRITTSKAVVAWAEHLKMFADPRKVVRLARVNGATKKHETTVAFSVFGISYLKEELAKKYREEIAKIPPCSKEEEKELEELFMGK